MRRTGARQCVVPALAPDAPLRPWTDFSSSYFERAAGQLPRQGVTGPFKLNQNYLSDRVAMRFGAVDDGVMRFTQFTPRSN